VKQSFEIKIPWPKKKILSTQMTYVIWGKQFCVTEPNMLTTVLPEPVFLHRNDDKSDHMSPVCPEE